MIHIAIQSPDARLFVSLLCLNGIFSVSAGSFLQTYWHMLYPTLNFLLGEHRPHNLFEMQNAVVCFSTNH